MEDGIWDQATCGDGVVDDGEDCDPGLLEDPCCDARCRLKEECTCAVADACCSDEGTFLEAGTPCRAARDPACDREETCTGQSTSFSRREIQELEAARRASLAADADRQRRYQAREAARRRERDDTAAAMALSRVTSGQSTSRSVRRPPAYSGAAPPPPPPPPPPNPFRATPSSRGESSYARRERLSRQMDF